MSFISSSPTINIGNSSSTTVNINSANTLNLGKNGGAVNIRGLDLLFTSTTTNFADISTTADPTNNIQSLNNYLLPYDLSNNLLIEWGSYPKPDGNVSTTFNFIPAFNSTPYVYVTKYNNGGVNMPVIASVTSTTCIIDSSQGDTDKASFNWIAIGLTVK